jgi:hypothetical protein
MDVAAGPVRAQCPDAAEQSAGDREAERCGLKPICGIG